MATDRAFILRIRKRVLKLLEHLMRKEGLENLIPMWHIVGKRYWGSQQGCVNEHWNSGWEYQKRGEKLLRVTMGQDVVFLSNMWTPHYPGLSLIDYPNHLCHSCLYTHLFNILIPTLAISDVNVRSCTSAFVGRK